MRQASASDQWFAIVDFVEEHGGSLSGEQRDELHTLVSTLAHELRLNADFYWLPANDGRPQLRKKSVRDEPG
jgi:hypothetical protein